MVGTERPEGDGLPLEVLLAWRAGLIDGAGVRAVCQARRDDPGCSAIEALCGRGGLDPVGRALLQALLRWQLARHGGDEQRLRATLAGPLPDRDGQAPTHSVPTRSIAGADDATRPPPGADEPEADPNASTRSARTQLGGDGGASAGSGPGAGEAADDRLVGGRYRIGAWLGEGSLGRVFEARDEEFDREVALKHMKPRADRRDEEAHRAQFDIEARVTGRLDHPGVVPVHSLGRLANGLPYYAMRCIRGERLKDAIARLHPQPAEADGRPEPSPARPREISASRDLELRRLLLRFIQVGNTVAYAHSRGVLHRDLKPSNIMLGEFGETLVVDWGLAKLLPTATGAGGGDSAGAPLRFRDIDPDRSTPGLLGGTVPYMSPEQARGAALTPASDIYSLGATLYTVLTGRMPVEETDVEQALERVRNGQIPRPREHRRDLPPALEAICLKAMALRPEDRYASARDLTADLERWLADEPVAVYAEPAWDRLRRWRRRHRLLIGVLATTLLMLAAASMPLLGLYRSAESARAAAQRNAELAERNFGESRELLSRYAGQIADIAAYLPWSEPLRRELADVAVERYERFRAERPDDPEIAAEAADVFRVAANIARLLEEDGPRPAGTLYDRARALYAGAAGTDVQARRRLALTYTDRGEWHRMNGRHAEAEADQRAALRTLGRDPDADPPRGLPMSEDERYARMIRAMAWLNLAGLAHERGDFAGARAAARRAHAWLGPLARGPGTNWLMQLLAAQARVAEAGAAREADDAPTAAAALAEALPVLDVLARRNPGNIDLAFALAMARIEQARLPAPDGDDAARQQVSVELNQALRVLFDLYTYHRAIPLYRRAFAAAYLESAEQLHAADRFDEARQHARRALELATTRLGRDGPRLNDRAVEAAAHALLGRLEDDPDAARDHLDAAIRAYEVITGAVPARAAEARALEAVRRARAALGGPETTR
jgi:serine/threonine protein kinase